MSKQHEIFQVLSSLQAQIDTQQGQIDALKPQTRERAALREELCARAQNSVPSPKGSLHNADGRRSDSAQEPLDQDGTNQGRG